MKKLILLIFILILNSNFGESSGGIPPPVPKMTFEEYNGYVVNVTQILYENRGQMYRGFHLLCQVIIVVFSALIPILLNASFDEVRKKKISTILSILIAIAVGVSSIFKFNDQSTLYSTAAIKLRKNFIDFDTDRGIYANAENENVKLNIYKYEAEEIFSNTSLGLIENLSPSASPTPKKPITPKIPKDSTQN
jgi:hypothetical protein